MSEGKGGVRGTDGLEGGGRAVEEKVVIIHSGVGATPRTAGRRRRGSSRRGKGRSSAMGQAAKRACEGAPSEAEASKLVATGDSTI